MPHLWMLTCLLGFTCLQATETSMDALEASCKDRLVIEKPVPVVESVFAFVYIDNADTTKAQFGRFNRSDGYFVKSPVAFSSQGSVKKIVYDSKTGELIVPSAGSYEVVYAASVEGFVPEMALAVNGKVIEASSLSLFDQIRHFISNTFVLNLKEGDHVSLVLPQSPRALLNRNKGEGHSVSLFIQKI